MTRAAAKQRASAEGKLLPGRRKKKTCYSTYFWMSLAGYLAVSAYFFRVMNDVQPEEYMDEIFHGPQTRKYCNGTFTEWDPKITTLPGTYLLAAGVLRLGSAVSLLPSDPEESCSIINLRVYNFILSIVNFFLIHNLNFQSQMVDEKNELHLALTTLNSALFPVLYFFGFMYYTDVTSLTFLLIMHLLFLKKKFFLSAVIGTYSVFVRQTNIVWVVFHGLLRSMDVWSLINQKIIAIAEKMTQQQPQPAINAKKVKTAPQESESSKDCQRNVFRSTVKFLDLYDHSPDKLKLFTMVFESLKEEIFTNRRYFSVGWYLQATMLFVLFVFVNGGIVVGDKEAHTVTVNLVQMGYYTLMFGTFLAPFLVMRVISTARIIMRKFKLAFLLLTLTFAVIVYFNTVVHPFVLADNRHVTFYLWKRVFAKYEIIRYLLTPFYAWVWLFIWNNLDLSINYRCVLILCCFVNFTPQLLLEFRYFIFPYILMRSSIEKPKLTELLLETLLISAINYIVFYFYVNYPFTWKDTPGYQRFMW